MPRALPLAEPEGGRREPAAVPAPTPARPSAVHRTRVEWMDTDASGHYHNSLVIRLLEAAEAAFVRDRGISGYFGVTPRVRQEITYEARLWFDQPVSCEVALEAIGRTSMTFSFEVWGEATGEHPSRRAASGRLVVVYSPDPEGGAQPWPSAWREAFTR